jgi:hypothetical protein
MHAHTWHGTELWADFIVTIGPIMHGPIVAIRYGNGPLMDGPIVAFRNGNGPFFVAHNNKPVYGGRFLGPLTAGLLTA